MMLPGTKLNLIVSRIREATPLLRCCRHTHTLLTPTIAGLGVELQYHADCESRCWPSDNNDDVIDNDVIGNDVTADDVVLEEFRLSCAVEGEPSTGYP
jgi:hypothetical protein